MKTKTPHIRLVLSGALLLVVLVCAAAAAQMVSAGNTGGSSTAYGWPVKPFDRPHPVRGSFGDPRTLFFGPPDRRTLLTGGGSFSFHFGIDVSAPDGTVVYPVVSGTVQGVAREWVSVRCDDGRSFAYWHVTSSVRVGQRVTAEVTPLGRIIHGCNHVHLAEFSNGRYVNPLQRGHLEPYVDTTRPQVDSITLTGEGGAELLPELVRGRIDVVAGVSDLPSMRVPGEWRDLPVTPAVVTWRLVKAATGKVVVPTRVAFDMRNRLPSNDRFWTTYARGTHQNMSVFGKHYSYMQPGVYLIRLTPGGLDTRRLPDEVYELQVTATDLRGNTGTLSQRFCLHNRPGVVGS